MKPSQLKLFLASAFAARMPVLIPGAPGIGKSDIVEQAAAEAGADLLISHPAVEDPTDPKGLPWVAEGAEHARFLPFGILAQALAATKLTVWFLDDLGQATPAVQAAYMQLLLARRVGEHVLPDCVTFVAATNRRTDRAGVSGILEPVKSRFASIVTLEADVDEWCLWALAQPWMPPEVVAFIRLRPELLSNFQPSADLTNSPSPRTWAHAAKLLGLGLPPQIQHEAIAGAVGEGAAVELLAFIRMYRDLPNIDAILMNPDTARIPEQPDARCAVATALATRANATTFGRIRTYVERMVAAGAGEYAAMLVQDALRRDPDLQHTKDYIHLATGELGSLMTGVAA